MKQNIDDIEIKLHMMKEDYMSMRERWIKATARCRDLARENEDLRKRVKELEDAN